jgi:hypothetical protein
LGYAAYPYRIPTRAANSLIYRFGGVELGCETGRKGPQAGMGHQRAEVASSFTEAPRMNTLIDINAMAAALVACEADTGDERACIECLKQAGFELSHILAGLSSAIERAGEMRAENLQLFREERL